MPARVAIHSASAVTSSSVSTGAARIASYVRWNLYLMNVPNMDGKALENSTAVATVRVRLVNVLSRQQHEDVLQVRGAPLAVPAAVGVHDRDARPGAAGAQPLRLGVALHVGEAGGRPVDLQRLGAG